jgi:hypothetical protein
LRLDSSTSPRKVSVRAFRASGLEGPAVVPVGQSDEGWGKASGAVRFVSVAGSGMTIEVVAVAS